MGGNKGSYNPHTLSLGQILIELCTTNSIRCTCLSLFYSV